MHTLSENEPQNDDMLKGKLQPHTIITSHSNPDFDALGAMVAAKKLYPDAALIMPAGNNQTAQKFLRERFFKDGDDAPFGFVAAKDVDFTAVRNLVLVDVRQADRVPQLGSFIERIKEDSTYRKTICIDIWDHHPDSKEDLEADNVHAQAWGSTVAILVKAMRERDVYLTPREATIISLGIYDDTGSFTFSSTTMHDMDAASWLLGQGMNLEVVANLVRHDFSPEQVSVLNMLLESATSHHIRGLHIVFTTISLDAYLPDFAALVSTMMDMGSGKEGHIEKEDQEITALFALARMGDKVQVVARSRSQEVDVQAICQELGGGGHPFAASASVKNKTLDEVHDAIFRHVRLSMGHDAFMTTLMSAPAITIEEHHSIKHAEEIMNRFGLKAIPVVQSNTKLCVGYLEYQTATRALTHQLGHFPITAYMQRDFRTITRHASLQEVMDIIIEHRQRIVPVVHAHNEEVGTPSLFDKQGEQDGNIIGVVTRTDLINAIVDASARQPEMLLPQKRKGRNVRHVMQESLPAHILEVLRHAGRLGDRLGLDVYIVGGFVRDLLLGQPNLDLDIVVEGDGIAFARIFAQELQGRVREHEAFKTARIIYKDRKGTQEPVQGAVLREEEQHIDVATARLEYYEYPAALPSVALSSIKMDLFRRDFTINALALQLNEPHFGKLVDFFNSQHDIKRGIVRVLHSLSFVEDPTRIMRAIRFEQRYGFTLGQQTMRLIKNALELELMNKLSGTRIFHEFAIISHESNALGCFERLNDLGVLQNIQENLALTPQKKAILKRMDDVVTWYTLLYLKTMPEPWLVWLLCLSHGANQQECLTITQRLSLTPSQTKRFLDIRAYIIHHDIFHHKHQQNASETLSPSALYTLFAPLELEGILYAMAVSNNDSLRKQTSHYLHTLQHSKADITGHDLRHMGLKAGPQYATILQTILHAKLDGIAPTRALQLEMARNIIEQSEKNAKTV